MTGFPRRRREPPESSAALWPFTAVTRAPGQQSQALYPVPGSGVQSHVESADGWTPDHGDLRFVGYLVDLTI
jgi:hypothetical protein